MPVEIDNRHPRLRVEKRRLAGWLRGLLAELGRPRATVDVSLVDDDEIQALNARWRGVDAVTDVLSFPLEEGDGPLLPGELLGDLVISLDTAARQAAAMQIAHADPAYGLADEVRFLACHGLLHLLGHDHQEAAAAAVMEALERRFMASVTALDPHDLDRSDHGVA